MCSMICNLVCLLVPSGLDDLIINPMGLKALDLARLGCSKMLIYVVGKDLLRDKGI